MSIHVPTLLEGILEATAAKAQAEARIATLRATLEDVARTRYDVEGAAPSWNTPQLGRVRLDPAGEWAPTVADPDAFGSYVAENHPTEATVVIRVAAADAADALQALEFISVEPSAPTTVEVRPAWRDAYLKALPVDVTEDRDDNAQLVRTVVAADPTTGTVVPGIGVTRSEAKLVVSLDRDRRTAAIQQANTTAAALIESATEDDDEAVTDHAALHARRVELEALHADQLATMAQTHGLGRSGTKAALAERIARREAATGHVVRPASDLPERSVTDVILGLVDSGLTIGQALATYATRDGGFTTPEVELERAARDAARGNITDLRILHLLAASGVPIPTDPQGIPAASSPLPEGTEVEEVTTLPAAQPEPIDQPVEEVPDGGDVAEAYDDDRPGMMRVHVAQQRATAIEELGSREVLRAHAKRLGVPASGTKRDVATALALAGHTADTLTAQEPTP